MKVYLGGIQSNKLRLYVEGEFVGYVDADHQKVTIHYQLPYPYEHASVEDIVDAINEYNGDQINCYDFPIDYRVEFDIDEEED